MHVYLIKIEPMFSMWVLGYCCRYCMRGVWVHLIEWGYVLWCISVFGCSLISRLTLLVALVNLLVD